MIVVLDTNVIVAALVAKGLCHEVVVRALGSSTVVTSPALLDELERTLHAKFSLGPAATAFLEQLRLRVHLVAPAPLAAPVSRDADDVDAAVTAEDEHVKVAGHGHGRVGGDGRCQHHVIVGIPRHRSSERRWRPEMHAKTQLPNHDGQVSKAGRRAPQTEPSLSRVCRRARMAPTVRSVWLVEVGSEAPRLVTAYPGKE